MNINNILSVRMLPLAFLAAFALGAEVREGENTAFDLAKEGNRFIGEQSKDKVVQIRSEKSISSLTPNVWHVVYYDPTATLKAVEVKFGAGKMLTVKRPMRLLEPIAGGDTPLDQDKLKVDSDLALKNAAAEPMLNGIKLTSARFTLEGLGEGVLGRGGPHDPVWKVRFWAAKIEKPNESADIGEIWISATDGKTVKNDLHLKSID